MSYRVQLPDTIEAENSVHALDPNAPVRRHQEAKTLIPRLVQHTHIRPILEEQPSNYTNASQRGIDPASVYHLVDIEFKDEYLNRLTIPSQCAPLLRVSPILNMPGVSSLQSVDFKGHTQGMAQTVSMIGNILGVNHRDGIKELATRRWHHPK